MKKLLLLVSLCSASLCAMDDAITYETCRYDAVRAFEKVWLDMGAYDQYIVAHTGRQKCVGGIIFNTNVLYEAAYISLVYVEQEFRGRKIAQGLMQQALNACRRQEVHEVELLAQSFQEADQDTVLHIYKKFGFQENASALVRASGGIPMVCFLKK